MKSVNLYVGGGRRVCTNLTLSSEVRKALDDCLEGTYIPLSRFVEDAIWSEIKRVKAASLKDQSTPTDDFFGE